MPPHFDRVLVLSVMSILVALFAWIYRRDRSPSARLWMMGWIAIEVHFLAAGIVRVFAHFIAYGGLGRLCDATGHRGLFLPFGD